MEIDPVLEKKAFEEAHAKFPAMSAYPARLTWRELFQGGAFQLQYEQMPPRDHPDSWEFQNAVVKTYKRLAGI